MTTAATHPYELSIENAGPARKRISITVPTETVDSKLKESLGMLRTQTVIPGFRKGKVPAHILEKRFGESIRSEARNEIVLATSSGVANIRSGVCAADRSLAFSETPFGVRT